MVAQAAPRGNRRFRRWQEALRVNVANTPPNNPVAFRVRPRPGPTPHNRQLLVVEKARAAAARAIPKEFRYFLTEKISEGRAQQLRAHYHVDNDSRVESQQ